MKNAGVNLHFFAFVFVVLVLSMSIVWPTASSKMQLIEAIANPVIYNNIFRYGYYCGPGPDDKFWDFVEPVDSIDETCQRHDFAYKGCLDQLSKDVGYNVPKVVHQIMPVRGFAPPVFIRHLFSIAPKYMTCMHHADKTMVNRFEEFLREDSFPHWWSQPHAAPVGAQGVSGYKVACAFGMGGHCILTSRKLFTLMLNLFSWSVEVDKKAGHINLHISTMISSMDSINNHNQSSGTGANFSMPLSS
jgi:hypothetical protein